MISHHYYVKIIIAYLLYQNATTYVAHNSLHEFLIANMWLMPLANQYLLLVLYNVQA